MDTYSSSNSLVSSLLGKKTNDLVYVLLTSIIGSFLLDEMLSLKVWIGVFIVSASLVGIALQKTLNKIY